LKGLAAKERELLYDILLTIKEINSRKLYLELGFSSLFSYLTTGVGYGESSAFRRIEAARLLKDAPELGARIQSGEITLNQISMVQKAARQVQKIRVQKNREQKDQCPNNSIFLDFLVVQKN
jgi:hypothetical protein